MKILARFERDGRQVKFLADLEPGFHYILTTSEDLREPETMERFASQYLLLHADMYRLAGYTRLELCPACHGEGWTWAPGPDSQGDPVRDVCESCQGRGGVR